MPGGDRPFEEREQHLALMEQAMLAGTPDREVIASAIRTFKVSRSTARRDCLLIRLRWDRLAAGEREDTYAAFGKAILRLDNLFKRALKVADKAGADDGDGAECLAAIGTALRLEQERQKLFGLTSDGPMKKLRRPEVRDGLPAPRGRSDSLFPEEPRDDATLASLPAEEAALVKLPEDRPGQ